MRPGAKETALLLPRKLAKIFSGPPEKAIKLERKRRDPSLANDHPEGDKHPSGEHIVVAFTHRYDPTERKLQKTTDI